MKVSVEFAVTSKRQKNRGETLSILVNYRKELDQVVVEKTMAKYSERLKDKFLFEKVTFQKTAKARYTFTCVANQQGALPLTSETFIRYLSNMGFVEITSMDQFGEMERQRLLATYSRYRTKLIQEASFKKFVSRKVIISKVEFTKLYQKLQLTRDTIEQLSYRNDQTIDWERKISECDIILNFIDRFYWNFGLFIMIDVKVKKELTYYSDFYDNMKDSELLSLG